MDQASPEPQINFKPDRTHNELRLAAKEGSDAKPKEISPSPIKNTKQLNRLSQPKLEPIQDLKI